VFSILLEPLISLSRLSFDISNCRIDISIYRNRKTPFLENANL